MFSRIEKKIWSNRRGHSHRLQATATGKMSKLMVPYCFNVISVITVAAKGGEQKFENGCKNLDDVIKLLSLQLH